METLYMVVICGVGGCGFYEHPPRYNLTRQECLGIVSAIRGAHCESAWHRDIMGDDRPPPTIDVVR